MIGKHIFWLTMFVAAIFAQSWVALAVFVASCFVDYYCEYKLKSIRANLQKELDRSYAERVLSRSE